jgi:hypothetical protein
MSIKLALLKSGEQVIADIKELVSEEKVCGYLFKKPQSVVAEKPIFSLGETEEIAENTVEIKMTSWMLLSADEDIAVPLDYVVTVVEPVQDVIGMYEEKIGGKDN